MPTRRLLALLAATLSLPVAPLVAAQAATSTETQRKPDLGDVAEGRYFGDVISDSKGSGRQGVTLTVTRVGVNRVHVASDYPRLPEIDVSLVRAMDKVVQKNGNSVFLYDPAKHPVHLDVSFDNAVSWSGQRQ